MKRAVALLLLLFAARSAAAQSQLRYTSHLEVRSVAATQAGNSLQPYQPAAGNRPPPGIADTVTVIGDHTTRTETGHPEQGILAGSISMRRGNTLIFLNTANKTFASETVPAPDPAVIGTSTANYSRTGEFATIAGVRAERVSFTIVIAVNAPGQPSRDLESTGDVWLANRFNDYAPNAAGTVSTGISLFWDSMPPGFPMKFVLRGGYLGPIEIQTTVTSIAEEPLQPSLFAPPADYREVPMAQLFRSSDARSR